MTKNLARGRRSTCNNPTHVPFGLNRAGELRWAGRIGDEETNTETITTNLNDVKESEIMKPNETNQPKRPSGPNFFINRVLRTGIAAILALGIALAEHAAQGASTNPVTLLAVGK